MPNFTWKDKIIPFNPNLLDDPLFKVNQYDKVDNQAIIDISKTHDSDFLKYLINSSSVYWKKKKKTTDELIEEDTHLLNKLCAIGYLLHTFRDDSKTYAVIAMDLEESEIGESNGGTGKSLLGYALSNILTDAYIAGKKRRLFDDDFVFEQVNERTDLLFFDDVRTNFDFEFLYPVITGKMMVNPKNKSKFTLNKNDVPKVYISTNHAVKDNGKSDKRRQYIIGFSDYYHPDRSPKDEFKRNLFSNEWDFEQWNQFYNLMALAVQAYFKYGKIEAPNKTIIQRKLRQDIGEDFIQWAEIYFFQESNLSERNNRKELTEDFFQNISANKKKYYSPQKFSKCFRLYAKYKDYRFNAHIPKTEDNPSQRDKTGANEFFTLTKSSTV